MPNFSRKTLIRRLGQDWLRDTLVGVTTSSFGSIHILDVAQGNVEFSGQGLYQHAWAKLYQSTNANGVEYRVATFNCGSGAFVTALPLATTVPSGADYEVHSLISPSEKGRTIDDTLRRLRLRQEITIPTVEGAHHYTIEGASGTLGIVNPEDVLDVAYYANPAGSLNRDVRRLDHWGVRLTASGMELRIQPALAASQQIVLDAVVVPTLGSGDNATVALPDDSWLLAGAAAKSFQMLTRRGPAQVVKSYRDSQGECAAEFTRLSQRYAPQIDRKIQLDDPLE